MENIKSITDIVQLYNKNQNKKEEIIQRALNKGLGMLHITEFVKVGRFQLNEILSLDMMWNTFQKGIPIYINNDLVKVFGYKGEIREQKRNLLKLIKKYNIPIIQLNNEEYGKFLCEPELTQNNEVKQENTQDINISEFYPKLNVSNGKAKTIHNLIMPRDLKRLFLVVDTINGDKAREYVLSLEDVFHIYGTYQKEYEKSLRLRIEESHSELLKKFDETNKLLDNQSKMLQEMKLEQEVQTEVLDEIVGKLDKATDERAPKTKSITKHGQFILVELNSQVSPWQYYVIRAQRASAKQALQKLRETYPNSTVKIKLSYQPNAINLFNLIKEELRNQRKVIKISSNYVRLGFDHLNDRNYSKLQFISDVKKINDNKKEVIYL